MGFKVSELFQLYHSYIAMVQNHGKCFGVPVGGSRFPDQARQN